MAAAGIAVGARVAISWPSLWAGRVGVVLSVPTCRLTEAVVVRLESLAYMQDADDDEADDVDCAMEHLVVLCSK